MTCCYNKLILPAMLHARPFVGGVPLYRRVQSGIEDLIRANPRAKAIPLSDAQLAERFGVSRITVRRAVFSDLPTLARIRCK